MFESDGLMFGEEAMGGVAKLEKVRNIAKSLGMDYTMGTTDQTGGAAIRHESLAATLKNVEATESSPTFWKAVKKGKAKGAVEEFAVLNEISQATSYPEFGMPEDLGGSLSRGYEQVKLVGAVGKVSFFAKSNETLLEAEAVETRIKTISMLKTLDVMCFHADAAKIPTDPNGIIKQAKARMKYPTQNVVDMGGKRLRPEDLTKAGRIIADNNGNSNNLSVWMDNQRFEDYTDELLVNRRFVVGSSEARSVIATAKDFELGGGKGKINTDIFLRHKGESYLGALHPKLNSAKTAFAAMSTNAPTQLDGTVCTATVEALVGSALTAATYDYAVVPANRFGAGKAFEIASVVVATDKKVTFSISDNGSPEGYEATKFDIYRKLSSATTKESYKFLFSVAATSGAATAVSDIGYWKPETSTVVVFDWDFDQVFTVDQLLPMVKLPLATIGDYKWWLQKIYWTPKVFNGSRIVIFENVGSTAWA